VHVPSAAGSPCADRGAPNSTHMVDSARERTRQHHLCAGRCTRVLLGIAGVWHATCWKEPGIHCQRCHGDRLTTERHDRKGRNVYCCTDFMGRGTDDSPSAVAGYRSPADMALRGYGRYRLSYAGMRQISARRHSRRGESGGYGAVSSRLLSQVALNSVRFSGSSGELLFIDSDVRRDLTLPARSGRDVPHTRVHVHA
jgi:hypothetical protein